MSVFMALTVNAKVKDARIRIISVIKMALVRSGCTCHFGDLEFCIS